MNSLAQIFKASAFAKMEICFTFFVCVLNEKKNVQLPAEDTALRAAIHTAVLYRTPISLLHTVYHTRFIDEQKTAVLFPKTASQGLTFC